MLNRFAKLLPCLLLFADMQAHSQKAALVQNVDEKGRVPFLQQTNVTCDSTANGCAVNFQIPNGQRLVLLHVNARLETRTSPTGVEAVLGPGIAVPSQSAATGVQDSVNYTFPVLNSLPGASTRIYYLNEQMTFFGGGGNLSLVFRSSAGDGLHATGLTVSVCGYLVPVSVTTSGT